MHSPAGASPESGSTQHRAPPAPPEQGLALLQSGPRGREPVHWGALLRDGRAVPGLAWWLPHAALPAELAQALYSDVALQAQELYLQSCAKEKEPGPVTEGWGGRGCLRRELLSVGHSTQGGQLPRPGLKRDKGDAASCHNTESGSSGAAPVPGFPPYAERSRLSLLSPALHSGFAEEAASRFPM